MSIIFTIMASNTAIVSIFSILLLLSFATSDQGAIDQFFQCLTNGDPHGFPISEAIYTPNNSSFKSVLLAYAKNRRFLTSSTPKPLAFIAAKHVSHVQKTVICAKENALQIRIRSGGHDYEGLSYVSTVPFVVIDMFNLRSIVVDIANETAWIEAGATIGELYYQIAQSSHVHGFPAGVCHSVGAGGHFSSGGYGNLMRKYGLAGDNIIDAQVVDVNGKILDRQSMGEDLFWAIRGGGGSSFGVILSWKIKLVRVPPKVTVFNVNVPLERGAIDVVHRWQQVASTLDKDLFIRVMQQVVNGSNSGEKTVKVDFIGLFLGETDRLIPMVNASFPELGLQREDCNEMSWVESTLFWEYYPLGTSIDVLLLRPPKVDYFFKSKSDFVKYPITKEVLQAIWNRMIQIDNMLLQFNPYGGRMSEISDTETPFPHRDGNLFEIQYWVSWLDEGAEITNQFLNLMRGMYSTMAPHVTKDPREALLNHRDLDIGSTSSNGTKFGDATVYGAKYFKHNFLRLAHVKAKVDPCNFFRNEQSIPPLLSSKGKKI